MTDYRATPEQWAQCAEFLSNPVVGASDACILELRARVQSLEDDSWKQAESNRFWVDALVNRIEALEANTKQWRTDHLRLANTCASLAPERLKFFNALLPEDEDSQPTPNPSQIRSSLVERVACAIGRDDEPINWEPEARAAIREVAAWLDENTGGDAAWMLTQEAGR
jgi:hypothetical protein